MKKTPQMNVPRVAMAVAGGALLMVAAAQLLAKPKLPPVARAIERPAGGGVAARTDSVNPASRAGRDAVTQAAGTRIAASQPRPAVAAEPPIREMFVPLVGTPRPGAPAAISAGKLRGPALPSAAPSTTSAPAPAAGPASTSTDARSSIPTVSEIQMLGVIEADGTPQVLLKRSTTGESRYFAKGSDAFGFTVDAIQESSVGLKRDGKVQTVAMSSSVSIEGPGGSTSAGSSGFVRSADGEGGRFGRDRGDRGDRGGRGDRGSRGDRQGGGESGAFSTADIFSLPTWTARLKKLEEVKAQIEPERYERLKTFMAERAKQETGK